MIKKFVNNIEVAKNYDKLPGYSKLCIEYLKNNYFNNVNVCDVGSGTGILINDLINLNINIFSVEPDSDMKKICDDKFNKFSNYKSYLGNAYDTLLDDNSMDYIVVGQALHLFDLGEFKKEANRILKNNKNIFIIYNRYDFSNDILYDMINLMLECYPTCTLRYRKNHIIDDFICEREANIRSCDELFDVVELHRFSNKIVMDYDRFMDFAMSFELYPITNLSSIDDIIANKEIDILRYKKGIIKIFRKYSVDDKISIDIYTDLIKDKSI